MTDAEQLQADSGSPLKILLIEDDPGDAVLFTRSLKACSGDYECTVQESLAEALGWLESNTCDAVILDLTLPDSFGMNGILQIHARFQDVPIVMLTGFDHDATALDALDHGAQDYLVKDKTSPQELERTLRHAVQRQQIQNQRRQELDSLKHVATVDSLTGALNRHAMVEQFEQRWKESLADGTPLACVLIDIDRFKQINDQYGHLTGDEVLRTVSQLISQQLSPEDCFARYGGEEFCAILSGVNEAGARQWAEKARKVVAANVFRSGTEELYVTASFGAAQRSSNTPTVEALINVADQMLLFAKKSGRDRVFSTIDCGRGPLSQGSGVFPRLDAKQASTQSTT